MSYYGPNIYSEKISKFRFLAWNVKAWIGPTAEVLGVLILEVLIELAFDEEVL